LPTARPPESGHQCTSSPRTEGGYGPKRSTFKESTTSGPPPQTSIAPRTGGSPGVRDTERSPCHTGTFMVQKHANRDRERGISSPTPTAVNRAHSNQSSAKMVRKTSAARYATIVDRTTSSATRDPRRESGTNGQAEFRSGPFWEWSYTRNDGRDAVHALGPARVRPRGGGGDARFADKFNALQDCTTGAPRSGQQAVTSYTLHTPEDKST